MSHPHFSPPLNRFLKWSIMTISIQIEMVMGRCIPRIFLKFWENEEETKFVLVFPGMIPLPLYIQNEKEEHCYLFPKYFRTSCLFMRFLLNNENCKNCCIIYYVLLLCLLCSQFRLLTRKAILRKSIHFLNSKFRRRQSID